MTRITTNYETGHTQPLPKGTLTQQTNHLNKQLQQTYKKTTIKHPHNLHTQPTKGELARIDATHHHKTKKHAVYIITEQDPTQ